MIQKQAFYMHLVSGDVQSGEDWIVDSADWCGDIPAQMASLIEVQLVAGEWVEV